MKRFLSTLIALAITISLLAACSPSEADDSYFSRIKRDGSGRLSVSLSHTSKEGSPLSERELEEIYEEACTVFSDARALLSTANAGPLCALNAPVETVFDIDPVIIEEIQNAFRLSELTDGLYQPAGGVLTSAIRSGNAPDHAVLALASTHMGTDKFEFSSDRLTKLDPHAQIDLAAYADGYALSAIIDYLKGSTVAYGTVTFNGIAGVFGEKPDGSPFSVEIGEGEGGSLSITDGFVALNSENFGTAYDYSDGVIEPTVNTCLVYSASAVECATLASVGYAHGSDALISIYEKRSLSFAAVFVDLEGEIICTENAEAMGLFSPQTEENT
ncbi:MAG: FAD:protein FMN transferase [Clostridia bacterium]|nr:FAD:protein FMN transferase [Clostridia bacterium]